MPLPLILGIGAGIAALIGVGAGCVATSDFNDAKSIGESAKSRYQEKKRKFDKAEQKTKVRIENYGRLKVDTYQSVMKDSFLPAYRKFEKLADISSLRGDSAFTTDEIKEIKGNIDIAGKIATGAVGGLFAGSVSGVGAAAGAWALAGAIGTASTGTAIAGLSGVAASNAAMAWLGGGALSAGGLGMAGGTMLLGGLVAGPVIAIAGFAMASKADKALTEACQFSGEVDKACAGMQRYITHYKALQARCDEITGLVKEFSRKLEGKTSQLNSIAKNVKRGFFGFFGKKRKLSKEELHHVATAFSYAKALKDLLDTPVVDEAGKINPNMVQVIGQVRNIT